MIDIALNPRLQEQQLRPERVHFELLEHDCFISRVVRSDEEILSISVLRIEFKYLVLSQDQISGPRRRHTTSVAAFARTRFART